MYSELLYTSVPSALFDLLLFLSGTLLHRFFTPPAHSHLPKLPSFCRLMLWHSELPYLYLHGDVLGMLRENGALGAQFSANLFCRLITLTNCANISIYCSSFPILALFL